MPRPPGWKWNTTSGFAARICAISGAKVGLIETGIDLADDLALEEALETFERILAGLIVRREDERLLVTEIGRVLAGAFMQGVVLPGHDEIVLVAFLAGEIRRAGIRADIDAAGIEHIGDRRAGDIGEHDAGEQLDAVRLHQLVGDLLALTGLQPVVLDHQLDRNAAELAAFHVDRELEGVADIGCRDSRRDPTAW